MSREALDRSHLIFVDINDQKVGRKYLIVEDSPSQRSVFQVDEVQVLEHFVVGHCAGQEVIMFSHLFPWKVVDKVYAETASFKELLGADSSDMKALSDYRKELRKTNKVEADEQDEGEVGEQIANIVPVGQYL